jgi:preprotein translocase subunit SecG
VQIFHTLLSIAQVLFAIALIFIVSIQQTKNEGLGGVIGGKVTSTFKGKPGFEERLNDITRFLGVGFFVLSIAVAVTMNR